MKIKLKGLYLLARMLLCLGVYVMEYHIPKKSKLFGFIYISSIVGGTGEISKTLMTIQL